MRRSVMSVCFTAIMLGLLIVIFHLGVALGFYQPHKAEGYAKKTVEITDKLFNYAPWCFENDKCGFNNVSDRISIECSRFTDELSETLVLFVFGQSQSANSASWQAAGDKGVYNFNPFDGKCYQAKDPLLGATGQGGSVWTILGNKLIAAGKAKNVLIVPFGVGGSTIERWIPGGDLADRIARSRNALSAKSIPITHVIWHQGAANAHISGELYSTLFDSLLRNLRAQGIDAPVYTAVSSYCKGITSKEITDAQRNLPLKYEGVFTGIETDTLGSDYRHDDCHFNRKGQNEVARKWMSVLFSE